MTHSFSEKTERRCCIFWNRSPPATGGSKGLQISSGGRSPGERLELPTGAVLLDGIIGLIVLECSIQGAQVDVVDAAVDCDLAADLRRGRGWPASEPALRKSITNTRG